MSKQDIFNYIIRNYAGFKIYELNWSINWTTI